MSNDLPTVAVCIATSGRAGILVQCVETLVHQSQPFDELLICPARLEDCDVEVIRKLFPEVRIVSGDVGLPSQRNALLCATGADVIIFLDDDFIMDHEFVAGVRSLFSRCPDIVVATGDVVADGILGPGLEVEEALALMAAAPGRGNWIRDVHNAYGCNMVVRMATVRQTGIVFDVALPLYGWLEDVDFCRRLSPFGRIVSASQLRGVHLGTKKGRGRGLRLGYSQIANPVYLNRKGSLSLRRAIAQMARNLSANTVKSLKSEPWVDRRGRLAGNLLGITDLLRGRLSPGRILEFD